MEGVGAGKVSFEMKDKLDITVNFILTRNFIKKSIMYSAVKGIYENGQIRFTEEIPPVTHSEVIITFLSSSPVEKSKGVRLGSLEGHYSIPDDFNEPLEDLKDYM